MSNSQRTHETIADQRERSKDVYETVLSAVDKNSGRKQPPIASRPSIIGTLHRAGYDLDEIDRAIVAARSNGDIFQTTDHAGRKRLGIDDRWQLRAKIKSHLEAVDDPRRDVIGIANARVQHLREQALEDESEEDDDE